MRLYPTKPYHNIQMLKDTPLAEGFSIRTLAEQAEGLSGSDLKELCRNAAMRPMREFMREVDGDHEKLSQSQKEVRVLFVLGHPYFQRLAWRRRASSSAR